MTMTSPELDNLVRINVLKVEAADQDEFDGLLKLGRTKLTDLAKTSLSPESQFDLAYNAAHALALAALRWHGFRPNENRFAVFQALAHTTDLGVDVRKILSKSHSARNRAEYQGVIEINEGLLVELINGAQLLLAFVEKLEPVRNPNK
jgi:hypothetical protein